MGKVPKKRGGKLTTTGNMGQHIVFLFLRFCTFFKIFHVRLGKKRKMLVFTGVYVCVKAKLTFVSFFFLFFAPFPYPIQTNFHNLDQISQLWPNFIISRGVRGGFGKRPDFFRFLFCAPFPYNRCLHFCLFVSLSLSHSNGNVSCLLGRADSWRGFQSRESETKSLGKATIQNYRDLILHLGVT